MRSFLTSISAIAIITAVVFGSSGHTVHAGGATHRVTGTGWVDFAELFNLPTPVKFKTTLAAFQGEDGDARGTIAGIIDYRGIGLPKVTFSGKVTCMHVVGKNAWVDAVVTHSTDEDFLPVGTVMLSMVRDLGGNGEDIMHTEPADAFPEGTDCTDEPEFLETVVSSGNFKVK